MFIHYFLIISRKHEKKNKTLYLIYLSLSKNNRKKIAKTYSDDIVNNPFKSFVQNNFFQCSGSSIYSKSLCMNHLYDERL